MKLGYFLLGIFVGIALMSFFVRCISSELLEVPTEKKYELFNDISEYPVSEKAFKVIQTSIGEPIKVMEYTFNNGTVSYKAFFQGFLVASIDPSNKTLTGEREQQFYENTLQNTEKEFIYKK